MRNCKTGLKEKNEKARGRWMQSPWAKPAPLLQLCRGSAASAEVMAWTVFMDPVHGFAPGCRTLGFHLDSTSLLDNFPSICLCVYLFILLFLFSILNYQFYNLFIPSPGPSSPFYSVWCIFIACKNSRPYSVCLWQPE